MKLSAVVILYHFGEEARANIQTYYDYVDRLYVFDNTETSSQHKSYFDDMPKVQYMHDFQNAGIAKRLNMAAEMALHDGYTQMLTMDQDSRFTDETMQYYLACIAEYKGADNVAMFGTLFSKSDRDVSTREAKPAEVGAKGLITSGSVLNLNLYKKIGGFDENLFIDHVDFDYCLRAHALGVNVICFENIYLHHVIGNEIHRASIKSLFLVKKRKYLHSPLRCYYMYRNMLYMEQKHRKEKVLEQSIREMRKSVMTYIKNFLLYGRNTRKMVRYLVAAARDYRQNRMGRITHEL